jgi:hypothetical protein
MRSAKNPSPTSVQFASWQTAQQSLYHACCQRTAAHRWDCRVATKREAGPLWRPR